VNDTELTQRGGIHRGMREANEIGSGNGACARQGRGARRRSAPFRSCSSLGFCLLEENRRAVQRLARLYSYLKDDGQLVYDPGCIAIGLCMTRTAPRSSSARLLRHLEVQETRVVRWCSALAGAAAPAVEITSRPGVSNAHHQRPCSLSCA